jgi:prevent-host-death family protein
MVRLDNGSGTARRQSALLQDREAVRDGEEVLLTDRGKPLARIVPIHPGGQSETVVRRLEAIGFLRAAANSHPMPVWAARPLNGVPITRTLREERESS